MALRRASTTVRGETAAAALAEALEALAPLATEMRDHDDGSGSWEVGGLFARAPDPAALAVLAHLHGVADFAVARVEDRDWVKQVQAELTPVAAGRFVVHGAHDRARAPVNRIGLEIEAAQAFGTGHHATTQGCLVALDRLARRGFVARRVADIGGGTGVLAMAAAALWPARAVAGDIDPVATATARANVAANGFRGRIACVTADGLRHPRFVALAPFDLVCANILAAQLKRLAPQIAERQAPGGAVVLSGILARQAPAVLARYAGRGYSCLQPVRIGDWTTLVLRRVRL